MKTVQDNASVALEDFLSDPKVLKSVGENLKTSSNKKKGEFGFRSGRTIPSIELRGKRYSLKKKKQKLARKQQRTKK